MDVKEAVATAKKYLADVFAQEGISNLGLEEVEFDDQLREWRVTLGFLRSWDSNNPLANVIGLRSNLPRSYKVVHIPENTTRVPSIKNREGTE
jgi:hypothetical protein